MNESSKPPVATRGRFGNVVNVEQVPAERWEEPSGRYGCDSREVAIALAAKDIGFCVVSLDAGRRSCPYHFHHGEEELFYFISGRGKLRQGDAEGPEEELEVGPGDFASFPAGTGVAHQIINDGDEPLVYLALSTRVKGDVAEYPDSNKVLIRATRMMLRREPTLKYFDGEV